MAGRHRAPRKSLGQRIASLLKPSPSAVNQRETCRPDAQALLKLLQA